MWALRFDRFLELLTSPKMVWGSVAGGFALLALALLVLSITRLGQSHPLRKCAILSLLTHVLLAAMLSTVHIAASPGPNRLDDTEIKILTSESADESDESTPARPSKPWERFAAEPLAEALPIDLERAKSLDSPEPQRQPIGDLAKLHNESNLANLPDRPVETPVPGQIAAGRPTADPSASKSAEPIEVQQAQKQDNPEVKVVAPAAPQRPEAATEVQPPAGEPSPGVVSASLLNQPVSVPRLNEPLVVPEPQSALLGATDSAARTLQPAPREAVPGLVTIERPRQATEPGRTVTPSIQPLMRRNDSGNDPSDVPSELGLDAPLPLLPANRRSDVDREVPEIYKLRVAPDRARVAQQQGGSLETEAAVNAALQWLATHQDRDGRWDASQFGAGREDRVLGHDRQGAGTRADTGVTGLALLAFLGAGHTHVDGKHQEAVTRGLEFLLRSQGADGNLCGQSELYAAMYSHGMAAIALSEAYALTRDQRLERPVRKAVAYTLATQHPTAGGWRYRSGDRQGDTSQLGWQLMALKSAKLAGIDIPARAEEGMVRFLKSVSAGQHGGLASYRANERASATMTAEALVCRNFLGMPADSPAAAKEAGDLILQELPGQGRANLYYWYYATLAMHQLQGDHWQKWNAALRRALVDNQQIDGPDAGSWGTNTVWGGYGGRVYTTAMGALCLEVYYRFLPLYE